MRVLVLGSTGLLGSTLAPSLRAGGAEVVTHGQRHPADHQVDLGDRLAVHAMLDQVRPGAVVHAAALSGVDACEADLAGAWWANARSAEVVAAWLRPRPEVTFVYLSTDQLYAAPHPCHEGEVAVRNVYGLSKYAGEQAALGVGGTVLRTNFFGPSRRPGRLSQSDWFLEAFRAGDPVTLFDDVRFNPLRMETVSAQVGRVLSAPRAGVFNLLARGPGMTKAAFARALARGAGASTDAARDGRQADLTGRAPRPADTRGDPARFEEAFGVTLPTLEDELAALAATS